MDSIIQYRGACASGTSWVQSRGGCAEYSNAAIVVHVHRPSNAAPLPAVAQSVATIRVRFTLTTDLRPACNDNRLARTYLEALNSHLCDTWCVKATRRKHYCMQFSVSRNKQIIGALLACQLWVRLVS